MQRLKGFAYHSSNGRLVVDLGDAEMVLNVLAEELEAARAALKKAGPTRKNETHVADDPWISEENCPCAPRRVTHSTVISSERCALLETIQLKPGIPDHLAPDGDVS